MLGRMSLDICCFETVYRDETRHEGMLRFRGGLTFSAQSFNPHLYTRHLMTTGTDALIGLGVREIKV